MIRNKRTTFVSCIDTDSLLTNRNAVPRLAGPIDDDERQFHYPTETPGSVRPRKVHPSGSPVGAQANELALRLIS